VRRTTVFTTHTPVPAGHDAFSFGMVEAHLAGLWGDLGDNRAAFLDLGSHDNGAGPMFNMTALAMRSAASVNGVSQLHGEVTRQMWQPLWPELPVNKVPVKSLTNGVHVPTVDVVEIARLLDRYLGPDWSENHDDPELCDRVLEIPDEELWNARVALRTFLFQFVRERARLRWTTEGGARRASVAAGTMFDQSALTIGYARRFTGYKRPELLFTDPQRLAGDSQQVGPARCSSSSPARRIPPTTSASTICSTSITARSTRCSAAASRWWTTTTCTWRTSWCRGATCG
jgi:starch phosphorylase